MKKLYSIILLITAFQFAQGQQVMSINYYYAQTQEQMPLDGLLLLLPAGDNFTLPMIAVLQNTGTQTINAGDTIFTRITFNGRVINNIFFAITQNLNAGATAGLRFYLPCSRSEVREGDRANELCSEVVRVIYSSVSTPIAQTPACATFTLTDEGSNIADFDISKDVKIYPNPVCVNLKIENLDEPTNISIYNTTGQIVRTVSSATGNVEINMSNISAGIYIVKMQNDKNILTRKIHVVK